VAYDVHYNGLFYGGLYHHFVVCSIVPFLERVAYLLFSVSYLLTVKFRQPSHEFTFGVAMNFISYPLVLPPLL
jgi:hypothetical protein